MIQEWSSESWQLDVTRDNILSFATGIWPSLLCHKIVFELLQGLKIEVWQDNEDVKTYKLNLSEVFRS